MAAWCSANDVKRRLSARVDDSVLETAASTSTSLLHALSGRVVRPLSSKTTRQRIDVYGRVSLREWVPVRAVTSVKINDTSVEFQLSPAKAYMTVSPHHGGKYADIELTVGTGVPNIAREAAAALAAELIRADPTYDGDDAREDPRLTSVTRQGTTWTYRDVTEEIKESLVGVYEANLFLRAVNPSGARHRARVVSP